MNLLEIKNKGNKNLEGAMELLKENGYDVSIIGCHEAVCYDESEYALNNYILEDEKLEAFQKLNEDQKQRLYSIIANDLYKQEIYDYEFIHYIISNSFDDNIDKVREV